MAKPLAVIIDDEPEIRNILKEVIQRSSSELGIDFETKTYSQCPKNLIEVVDASIFFIDYNLPKKDGLTIAKELKELNSIGARVMITGYAGQQELIDSIKLGLFDDWIQKPEGIEKIIKTIESLRERKRLRRKLNIGVVGLGNLGETILSSAKEKQWGGNIEAFSTYCLEDDYSLIKDHIEFSTINFHQNIESLIEAHPDVLLLTTGEYITDYEKYQKRVDMRKRLYEGSLPKVMQVLEVVKEKDYRGFIINASNPVGDILLASKNLFNLDAQRTSGLSVLNTRRTKNILIRLLQDSTLKRENINLRYFGEHGGEGIKWRSCTIKGERLYDLYPEFKDKNLQDYIIQQVKEQGLKTMTASRKLKRSYEEAAKSMIEMLSDLAHMQKSPQSCWYIYNEEFDAFLSWPVEIIYNDSINIRKDSFDLDEEIYSKLHEQANSQRRFMEENLQYGNVGDNGSFRIHRTA